MDKININEINRLSEVYHELIFLNQQKKTNLFSNKLKGVTTIEISILEIIEKKPDVILKEILEILGVPNSTLTNAINRLEKRKLIRRVISGRDRRSFGLELTEEGKLAQKEHREDENKLFKRLLMPLTTEERGCFISSLRKIVDSFNKDTEGNKE